jgi:hypothetical protein
MTVPRKSRYVLTRMSRPYCRVPVGTQSRDPRDPPTIRQMIERLTKYVRRLSLLRSARIGILFLEVVAVCVNDSSLEGPGSLPLPAEFPEAYG